MLALILLVLNKTTVRIKKKIGTSQQKQEDIKNCHFGLFVILSF
jgi:hypothetical protein